MDDINNRIRNAIRDYGYEHRLTFHDQREHAGLLRNMMIRYSNTGELMLLMLFCITIVGIPFGMQCFKFAKLALCPFGSSVAVPCAC